ncbi:MULTISPECIES: acyl-CoA dehydrogenase family protein [unclassified Parafrankia]|uniref:acyl-CoA dehydrogenase family protein n=1 Tax=unclassified Parafrankia TaxID=2994368 RepID=UPI000DA4FFEC|nr:MULTISPECIES: acyl-CoA dehydrogenase family protein [unclassified Parafrankia]TCJ40052.1 acyl-CoA dehydrogenase [Parafrankia sp. BMG5.11]SQD95974.1 Acyl-CoA dehydrogenase domain protein [Parafrankia sp. Ea1.12]
MRLSFTAEHEQLRRAVRDFLAERSPAAAVRRLMDSTANRDEDVWTRLSEELGLVGLGLPEQYGGSGFGEIEVGIVLEEMGRALLVAPYLSTAVLAGQTLATSEDQEAQQRWLPGIAAGSLTATLAVADESGSWELADPAASAEPRGGQWLVSGPKYYVLDGHSADLLLVVARAADGTGVFAVEGAGPGVVRARLDSLDPTRDLASVLLREAPAVRVGAGRDTTAWLGEVHDRALAALASEQIGGAARCLELAVDYAKVREQFGRPIGSFQAIKHKCAALLVEVESARSAVYHANAALAADDPEETVAAAVASAYASRAFTLAAKECIQIHGGIGFTWEHDAHLFLRRAKSSELFFGAPRAQRSRLADLVGI